MTTAGSYAAARKAPAARATLCMAALLSASALCGCGYIAPELPYAKLATPYNAVQLGRSTSLEVLNVARAPAYQFARDEAEQVLLTQGDTAISYSGRSADTRKTWLNLVAFDEYRMTARRKYFFCIDERARIAPVKPKYFLIPPREGSLFDAEFIIDPEVLTTPYATAEAQQIAILQWLAGQFARDVAALVGNPADPAQGSEAILLSSALVSQVFQGVLVELDKSPGLAKNLTAEEGVPFPHMSLGAGRIRMVAQNDLAAVRIHVNLPMVPLNKR